MRCEKVVIKRRRVCYGDLNRQVILHTRSIVPPDTPDDYDYDEEFTAPVTIWAAIQTVTGLQSAGIEIFDGVNLLGLASHTFFIKFKSGLTSESFLEYKTEYYKILRIENLDENDEYMALYTAKRGDKSIKVNQQ